MAEQFERTPPAQRAGAIGGKGIAGKMAMLRDAMGPVEKDGLDRHLNRRYISTEAMLGAVREAARQVGVATTCRQRLLEWGIKEGGKYYNVVEVTLVFVDPDTGEYDEMVGIGTGEDQGARVTNISVTYALKNLLKAGFLIGDDAENDAQDLGTSRAAGANRGSGRAPRGLSDQQAQEIRAALAGVPGDQVRSFLSTFGATSPGAIPPERFDEAKAQAARLPRPVGRKAS